MCPLNTLIHAYHLSLNNTASAEGDYSGIPRVNNTYPLSTLMLISVFHPSLNNTASAEGDCSVLRYICNTRPLNTLIAAYHLSLK